MSKYIDKGTLVRIRTTNGADIIVKLLEEYDPTRVGTYIEMTYYTGAKGEYYMPASRIRSIEVSNTYWTPPLTAAEVENIRDRVAQLRSVM